MLSRAAATDDIGQNRADALIALQVISTDLTDPLKEELYGSVLPFAAGDYDQGTQAPSFAGADDPLSRTRISLGPSGLERPGLLALAALATTAGQAETVEELVLSHLRAGTITPEDAVRTLLSLPGDPIHMPVAVLSTHSSPAMRALGAVLWARRTNEPETIGIALARDAARIVRASLASSLSGDPRHDSVRGILVVDPRRSVRRLVATG